MPRLETAPELFRIGPSRGGENRVIRGGGAYGAGLIRRVSVTTRGEALGHEQWNDAETLRQVAAMINDRDGGIKSRFTHPDLSGDGLGKTLARVMAADVVGDQVFADLHLLTSAHDTPNGNLADYILRFAEESPEDFGLSIAFHPDEAAAAEFVKMHTTAGVGFQSPDEQNVANYPHVRLKKLAAVDFVDEPAANPAGLFDARQTTVVEAAALADYALGLTDEKPEAQSLGLDADRLRGFVRRHLANHGLILVSPRGDPMSHDKPTTNVEPQAPDDAKQPTAAAQAAATVPVADGAGEPAAKPTPAPEREPEPVAQSANAKTGQDYLDAFGDQGGVWYAQGKTFAEAQRLYIETLQHENAALKKHAAALHAAAGEPEPIELAGMLDRERKQAAGNGHTGLAGKIAIASRN